ncbi:hypothetical protein D9M68_791320 [compost metagenome]
MIASVSGKRIRTVVPRPNSLMTSTSPRNCSMLRRTTSMPTPRPERLVIRAAVENPGSKIRRRISLSLSTWSGCTRPFSTALAKMRWRSSPLPSSLTSMTMLPDS